MIDFSPLISASEYSVYELVFNSKRPLLRIEMNQIIGEIWKYILTHVKCILRTGSKISNITSHTVSKFHSLVVWTPDSICKDAQKLKIRMTIAYRNHSFVIK